MIRASLAPGIRSWKRGVSGEGGGSHRAAGRAEGAAERLGWVTGGLRGLRHGSSSVFPRCFPHP